MLKNLKDAKLVRDTLLSLLPTCGTMAGIDVGLAGLVEASPRGGELTLADEFLLASALGFLLICYLVFFAMRDVESVRTQRVMTLIDWLFLSSLTLTVFSGFVVAYEFI